MRIINLLKSCFFGDPHQTMTTNFLSFTLARPSTSHFLRITDRSWQHAFPRLWNQLPASLHQPRTSLSSSDLPSLMSGTSSIGSIDSPLSSSITLLLTIHSFIPGLKPSFSAYPSHRSLPFLSRTMFTDTSEHIRFLLLVIFSIFHFLVVGSVW